MAEEFNANKPFSMILIANESVNEDSGLTPHNVLFYGKVTDPSIIEKVQRDEL